MITPSLETVLMIGNQIPMLWALAGIGRFSWVSILKASIRISMILLMNENRGPSGKATVNRVINPNWITIEIMLVFFSNESSIFNYIPISRYSSKRVREPQLIRSRSLAYCGYFLYSFEPAWRYCLNLFMNTLFFFHKHKRYIETDFKIE